MCGIVACLGNYKNISKTLYESLKQLQNRGYDSVGISVHTGQIIITEKCASREKKPALKQIKKRLDRLVGIVGMGHTRWATHGGKSERNSHPHFDNSGLFGVVHNGIIENYK